MTGHFLDTFVLIEFLRGNEAAQPYFEGPVATTVLNLCELRYWGLVHESVEATRGLCSLLTPALLPIPVEVVEPAMIWRHQMRKKRGFSYIDTIGYWVARSHGLPFVTASEFDGVPGVMILEPLAGDA